MCCFCGKSVDRTATDPCRVTVETAEGKEQIWYSHGACYRERLANLPDAPDLFEPAYF
jgi:hypothetical protein